MPHDERRAPLAQLTVEVGEGAGEERGTVRRLADRRVDDEERDDQGPGAGAGGAARAGLSCTRRSRVASQIAAMLSILCPNRARLTA